MSSDAVDMKKKICCRDSENNKFNVLQKPNYIINQFNFSYRCKAHFVGYPEMYNNLLVNNTIE